MCISLKQQQQQQKTAKKINIKKTFVSVYVCIDVFYELVLNCEREQIITCITKHTQLMTIVYDSELIQSSNARLLYKLFTIRFCVQTKYSMLNVKIHKI